MSAGGVQRFIILERKDKMAGAGWVGSSSANRWLTLSVVLPCLRATKPKSLEEEEEEESGGSQRWIPAVDRSQRWIPAGDPSGGSQRWIPAVDPSGGSQRGIPAVDPSGGSQRGGRITPPQRFSRLGM
ncbi:unnamed protein product [Arctogadus glacialis]